MKICPTCKKSYKDEELNYCLDDGATLVKKKNGAPPKHSRVNEVMAVGLLALALLTFFSVVSYSPSDPTFNTASGHETRNWVGVIGANLSELLLSIVGVVAYLFPALIALIAWRVFQSDTLRPKKHRIVGFVLFVAGASGLASMAGWHGGIIGAFFAHYSVELLSVFGGVVFLGAMFIISVLLITNLSFLGFWGNFEVATENFKIHFDEWKENRRRVRESRLAAAKDRMEKRREIREQRSFPDSPTISIGDVAATSPGLGETVIENAGGAAGTMIDPFPESFEEMPPPTIAVDDPEPTEPKRTKRRNGATEKSGEADTEDDSNDDPSAADLPRTDGTSDYSQYTLPTVEFLVKGEKQAEFKKKELLAASELLSEKTKEFNVSGKVVNICPGPVVTTFEFKPDPGVKYSRVTRLVDDLCLALKAESIRIDRIPGKAYVGIEVPNEKRETIRLRDVIESKKYKDSASKLTIALGKTIDGLNYVTDLAKMPHLLIAGATGAGKSVGVNSIVVSILYKARPDEVKFIMVDPKRLELGLYADIPHLATPIITDPKRAAMSLKWAVTAMERRYKDLAGFGVRNIDGYNVEVKRRNDLEQWDDNGEPHRSLPYVVIIIDELADLMMVSGKDVEESITRLAQMARAVGIHLVLATQRPSVDVITGLIKANFSARISFRVSSKVDSRTIIDGNGAEGLLGRGDMLFLPPGTSQVIRVHGAFVDEKEINQIVGHVKSQGRPEYDVSITKSDEELDGSDDLPGKRDPLFWDALKCVVNAKRGSTSLLQRHLRIGYGRAAAILDAMVKEGYIGDMDGSSRARPVLQKAYDDLRDVAEGALGSSKDDEIGKALGE
jgi:DNA segregation ATPase FtsK/SpoIIIE, S-DNA-T family